MRAVTFQSMVRTSSPGAYSRTSANSMPRPLKTAWYAPPIPDSRIARSSGSGCAGSSGGSPGRAWAHRDLDPLQDPVHDRLARDVLGLGLVGQQDAVAQHVLRDLLDVLGHHVAAAAQEGHGPRGLREGEGGARRGAEGDEGREVDEAHLARVPGGGDEGHHVVAEPLVHVDLADPGGEAAHRVAREHPRHRRGLARDHAVEDLPLLLLRRVVDLHLQQEAVHLRLGQRIGALLLDRVLGGEHEERDRAAGGWRRRG